MMRYPLIQTVLHKINLQRLRYIPAIAVACMGLGLSFFAYGVVAESEDMTVERELNRAARRITALLSRGFDERRFDLMSLQAFHAASEKVTRDEFRRYVKRVLADTSAVKSMEWIPRVPRSRLPAFVEEAGKDGFSGFRIRERRPSGRIVPSPLRDEYFPVYYVEPSAGNENVFGLNLASDTEIGPHLALARDTGQMVSTGKVEHSGNNKDEVVFRLIVPVYRKEGETDSIEERRRNLEGFYSGVYRLEEFVGRSLAQDVPQEIDFFLFDDSSPEGDGFLYAYSFGNPTGPSSQRRRESAPVAGLHEAVSLDVGQRNWRVVAEPTLQFMAAHHTWQPAMVFIVGVLATMLVTSYLVMIQREAVRSRRFAAEQVRAKQQLEKEISERRLAEKALRESEEKYRTLFEQSRDAILIVAGTGRIIDANGSCGELFGVPRQQIVGCNILDFYYHPERRQTILREIERHGFVKDWEWKVRRKDNSHRDCLMTSSLWKQDDGTILGYLTIVRDVTESKRLEERLQHAQKMESLGTLTGGIAHDFNNLLQVINGYADMALLNMEEGDKWHSRFREIRTAARSAAELTQGLLTFSRRVESNLRPVDINRELQQVAKMLKRTIPKMIEIEMNPANDLPPILADPAQLQQALLNLGVNARDSMPQGGTLAFETGESFLDENSCTSSQGKARRHCVFVRVSDNGSGMDKKTVDRIFDPFFTTKEAGKGTGLGLSIVYGIVKNHGGSIVCDSKPGKGTTFMIYLPATTLEPADFEWEPTKHLAGGSETILFVDDEESVRALGASVLRSFGYECLTASNGREGLEVYSVNKDRISLTILDLVMPEMSGRECLQRILAIEPNAKVLVASGYDSDGSIDQALENGAKGSLRKPYETGQLIEMVRRVLDEG